MTKNPFTERMEHFSGVLFHPAGTSGAAQPENRRWPALPAALAGREMEQNYQFCSTAPFSSVIVRQ
jgi:hypothetical protein